jgi:hypothetical protein
VDFDEAPRRFDKAAFAAARNAGLMVINLRAVFGESARHPEPAAWLDAVAVLKHGCCDGRFAELACYQRRRRIIVDRPYRSVILNGSHRLLR